MDKKITYINHLLILVLIGTISLISVTCTKIERNNPWDTQNTLDPKEWAPENISTEELTIFTQLISWEYEGDNRIEGFKIDRKIGESDWEVGYKVFSKDDRSWIDKNIIPDTTLIYAYRLYAFAGEKTSSIISFSINAPFNSPNNVKAKKISNTQYEISWESNSIGADGFIIDRKIDDNHWEIAYATTSSKETHYVDTAFFSIPSRANIHYRIYAYYENYKSKRVMVTLAPPIVITTAITDITGTSAKSGGHILSNGMLKVVANGVCWSKSQNPTIEDMHTSNETDVKDYHSNIHSLMRGTTYYVRAYATNEMATSYGSQISFTTLTTDGPGQNIEDIDGNNYKTIWIDGKLWLAENLKTTKYNDGTNIPHITDSLEWPNLKTGAYCWYYNDKQTYGSIYGGLYNWYAVETNKICPTGWHVPTIEEWKELANYVCEENYAGNYIGAGKALKSTYGWSDHLYGKGNGDDTYGFTALPAGMRLSFEDDDFYYITHKTFWWSNAEGSSTHAFYTYLTADEDDFTPSFLYLKIVGASIRCIKDD